jgi:hypothetical protein
MKKITLIILTVFFLTKAFGQINTKPNEISQQLNADTLKNIDNPEEYIKKETIGGKLDFNKLLENERSTLFLFDGVAYNKKDFGIFLWGKKVRILGISSSKRATLLWEEINNRQLTQPEKRALERGFDNKG